MIHFQKEILWRQFGASIDMLGNAIELCPEQFWDNEKKFWYNAYHCLFFLDYYLTLEPKNFTPPSIFSLSEFEDRMPERTYTKEELLYYVDFCKKKCKKIIAQLDEQNSKLDWVNQSETMRYNIIEILLYNMRHVQHHAAQLNLILRQEIDNATDWIYETNNEL